MKKIIFICPYFGVFPNYFKLTLNSIKYNKTIDWLIITDIVQNYNYPSNVKIINMSFNELRKKVQSYFDFTIALDAPFKMCDFRPAYGLIFKDYIKGYDFWGHCDFDCIYGNLRKFLPEEVLDNNERIYCLGHMSLYKNNKTINNIFKKKIDKDTDYKDIFAQNKSYSFDEMGIIRILSNNNINIYNDFVVADIYPWEQPLQCVKTSINIEHKNHDSDIDRKTRQVFEFDNGKLNAVYLSDKNSNEIKRKEYMYIHLQRRFMKYSIDNVNKYLIIPNKFIDYRDINKNFIISNSKNWILYKRYLKIKRSIIKRNLKLKKMFI